MLRLLEGAESVSASRSRFLRCLQEILEWSLDRPRALTPTELGQVNQVLTMKR